MASPPASVLPDAPIVIEGSGMETAWRPKNSDGEFNGPTRLREALAQSLNLVSIRCCALGIDYAINYVTRFGFDKDRCRTISPWRSARWRWRRSIWPAPMPTFANGGFRVSPYYIDRIEDVSGKVHLARRRHPLPACNASRPRI